MDENSATDFTGDYLLARIRQKLQDDGVKLWAAPFYDNNSPVEDRLRELAVNYSDVLAIPDVDVVACLRVLQANALEKLASRAQFQQTGMATLKVKMVGIKRPMKNIVMHLSGSVASLETLIVSEMSIPPSSRLKLISHGLVLEHTQTLQAQRVTNNSLILALILPNDSSSQRVEEQLIKEIESIKEDAALLAGKQDGDFLRIADQSGNVIDMPVEEKKSLAVAMALHEKGRSAIKRNQLSLALTLLHEADAQFGSCRSELLNAVDNAGLLNLDIAWCYLLLGSAPDIPDAVARLDKCEKTLCNSYGPNMERLLTLKGTTGNEAVLFVRLHLLQGVVAFHQGKTLEATKLLQLAKGELEKLAINDDDLSKLIALGFSVADARLGLRAQGGNVNSAVVYLQRRQEEWKERRRKEKDEEKRNRERRKLGKTANGSWVNLGYLNTMIGMGYNRLRAAGALRQTDNDLNRAFEYLQSDLESSSGFYNEEALAQLLSLGFPEERAREMLSRYNGDVELSVEALSNDLGTRSGNTSDNDDVEMDDDSPGPSGSREDAKKKERDAYDRLAKDISESEYDHLDTNLELENEYLSKYLSFLSS